MKGYYLVFANNAMRLDGSINPFFIDENVKGNKIKWFFRVIQLMNNGVEFELGSFYLAISNRN